MTTPIGIDSLGLADLCQTLCGHFYGHSSLAVLGIVIGNGEIAVRLLPGGHGVFAGGIGEDFQDHVALGIGHASGQGIDEGIAGQVGSLGSDAGQGRNDLVVNGVTSGGGAGVGVIVRLASYSQSPVVHSAHTSIPLSAVQDIPEHTDIN